MRRGAAWRLPLIRVIAKIRVYRVISAIAVNLARFSDFYPPPSPRSLSEADHQAEELKASYLVGHIAQKQVGEGKSSIEEAVAALAFVQSFPMVIYEQRWLKLTQEQRAVLSFVL